MAESWIRKILTDEVSNKYHIEHHDFHANHMAHGMVALHHLGASKERIQKFVDWYMSFKVEPKDDPRFKDQYLDEGEVLSDPSKFPKGSRTKFFAILDYIEGQMAANGGDYKKAVAEHFPNVSDGLYCSLFHPLIQTGYGICVDCPKTVAEGLAYGYHSFSSVYVGDPETSKTRDIGNFGNGTMDLLDVLNKLKVDQNYKKKMEDRCSKDDLKDLVFLLRLLLGQFLGCCKELQTYADSLKLPDELDLQNLDVDALGTWIVDLAMTLYGASEVKNDFGLLHGVTGAWALKQIFPLLADQKQEVLRAARTFCMSLLAMYMARDSYQLNPALITVEQNENIDDKFWEKIKTDMVSRICDEHYYKLVHIAYDMWKLNRKQANLYGACAKLCLDNPIFFTEELLFPLDDKDSDISTLDFTLKSYETLV